MSDDTQGPAEFDDSEAEVIDDPEVEETPSHNALPRVASGVTRRTAPAPVRKKDVAAALDPEAADAAIDELEEGFSDEENAAAQEIGRSVKAPVKKATATRRRSESARAEQDPYTASNPAEFTKQSVRELKQVVWPTWPELVSYFTAVLVFVLFFIAFIGGLDLLFGWSLLQMLGGK